MKKVIDIITKYNDMNRDISKFKEAVEILKDNDDFGFRNVIEILKPEIKWRETQLKKMENMEIKDQVDG